MAVSKPKISKATIKNLKRKKNKPFLRLTNIWLAIGIILIFSIVINLFNTSLEANEIQLNEMISKIKNNEYSALDIRDDGRVVAQEKYIYATELEGDISLRDDEETVINGEDDLEEVSLEELISYIKPLSFTELLDSIKDPNSIVRVSEIYIGDDFIIANNNDKGSKDLIVYQGEEELDSALKQEGVNISEVQTDVTYLRVAVAAKEQNEIEELNQSGIFSEVWTVDNIVLASLNEEEITLDFIWKPQGSDFIDILQKESVSLDIDTVDFNSVLVPTVPWGDLITFGILLGFGLLALFMFRGIQGSGSSLMKFGQSKARVIFGRKPDITFKDVAGVDEAKEELREIVLFLKEPKRFLRLGARIPKGVLMVGAPGTGKTLLARAIAGEAGVPFFHTSGSEFEEMLVGAGASRVRDLFEKAKKAAPSIIFIDEIDAVARKRGTTIQSGTTEQTLNQILVEMDGFQKNTNVIVIAATNRPDVLDKAILRPGRFDRRVVLDLPDIEGRKEIIKIHAQNKPISPNVDLEVVAKRTVGFSGADIENMLNEAAIIVAKDNRKEILMDDLEEASNKVQIGPAKKRKRSEKELRMTAYHEAGHALVMKLTPEHDPVHRVTIVSRGMALGYTMPLPDEDQVQTSKTKMLSKITSLVAGFATEEFIFGDVTSGASNDIQKASDIARRMVKEFGMSKKLGLVKYGQGEENHLGYNYETDKNYSEETSKIIDEEVRSIIDECYANAQKLLKENKDILDKLVEALLEKEVLDGEEFNKFFE